MTIWTRLAQLESAMMSSAPPSRNALLRGRPSKYSGNALRTRRSSAASDELGRAGADGYRETRVIPLGHNLTATDQQ